MDETTTASGLIVRAVVPRDNPPTAPAAPETASSSGFGSDHVLYDANIPPPPMQAWSGWPVEWNTPNWGGPGWLQSRTSTVGTCCDKIGRTCATFPPVVVRGATERLDPQPLWTSNPEPNLYSNFDEWLKGSINSLLLRGEMFVVSTGRNAEGYPVRWITLNPDSVSVELINGRLYYEFAESPLTPADVLHVKYQSVPGSLRGIAPLDWIAKNLIGADALASYGADLASRGGVPWGVLTHPGNLREGQAEELRSQWVTAAAARGAAPAVLSGGMTLQTLSLSPESMALLSLREFDEQRIAAAFGMPPFMVGLPQPSGLNYTSSEMLADDLYRQTLKPMVKNIADALSLWALPRGTNMFFDATEYISPPLPAVRPNQPAPPPTPPPTPDGGIPMPQPVGVKG